MARHTLSLLLAVLMASVPYDAYGKSPKEVLLNSPDSNCFHLDLNSAASKLNGTFFAFGQDTTALKAQNMLPHCSLAIDHDKVCTGKSIPNLTLEHITEPHFYFPALAKVFVRWDNTTFPRLQPNHTGVYRCKAGNLTSKKTYNLSVVVPSRINCMKPEYPSEREVSVSCTVYGYPKPTVLWKGHTVPNITKSEQSYPGVYECNSTAVFQLPDILTDDTSASISLEVFHNPPMKCTVVAGDSSIQERCNNASRNITESIAITPNCSVVSQELNRTYLASGQETEALKTHNVLPYCRKKHVGRCIGKTIHLTLRHTDEPQFNFTAPNVSNDVTWNSTRFPRLEPFHSGGYVCEADHEQFDTKYNLQVVVPSRTDCQLRQDLVKKVVSVNCTVCGYPEPKARWEGKYVNFTDSQSSYRNGVHEYNSTAVFPLPGNWTDNPSVSVSIEVYHDPPVDCTAVIGDLSIQQRCNDTSSNISTTFAISPGKMTVESRGIYDVQTQVTYLDPRVYGQQSNNCGDDLPWWVVPLLIVLGVIIFFAGCLFFVLCLMRKNGNTTNHLNVQPTTDPAEGQTVDV